GAEMDEDVLAILLGDEAVALRVVEPLDLTLCHCSTTSCVFPAVPGGAAPREFGGPTKNAAGPWSGRRAARAGSAARCYGRTQPRARIPEIGRMSSGKSKGATRAPGACSWGRSRGPLSPSTAPGSPSAA